MTWVTWSLLSALFAAATALLAKMGVTRVEPNLATAIRDNCSFAARMGNCTHLRVAQADCDARPS